MRPAKAGPGPLGACGFYQPPLCVCYPRQVSPPPTTGAGAATPNVLVKRLVAAGVGSRRRSAALIMEGAVTVNGEPALDLNRPVAAGDVVCVNGEPAPEPELRTVRLLLHKPPGYLSTASDDRGRPTVLDLVPPALRVPGLVPAGRLDLASAGLMLLTNDGALVHRVTHPRYGVEKEYAVVLDRPLGAQERRLLETGVPIEGGVASAVEVAPAGGRADARERAARYRVVLVEGKKREVRLMMAAVGRDVLTLTRVRIGGLRLGALPEGAVRELSVADAARLLAAERPARPDGGQGRRPSRPDARRGGRPARPGAGQGGRPARRSGQAPPAQTRRRRRG